jgi:phosphatidate cytidylyltransferase
MTDTAAYFSGRTIGGPKLWPAVSPKKTWAGLIGGVSGAALVGAVFPTLTGSGFSVWLAILGLVLGLIAQAGDLAESALKRHYGLKDASDLIPGHGGFMDRMDGVVTASVFAALVALAIDAYAPARALLYGS